MQANTNNEAIAIKKLFEAIELGNLDGVKALVIEIDDLNVRNQYGNTPLYEAVYGNHIAIIAFLLSTTGVDPNIKGYKERTPLLLAVIRGNISIVKLLLDQRANIECKNEKNQTALAVACLNEKFIPIAELLLNAGANTETQDDHGKTPLHHAAETDNLEALVLLIAHKANLSSRDNYQRTPLHYAAQKDAIKVMQCLLAFGAEIEAQDNKDRTSFHLAKRDGAKKSVKLLVFHGANQDAKDVEGYKPGEVGTRHKIVRATKRKQNAKKEAEIENLIKLGFLKSKLEEKTSIEDRVTSSFSKRTQDYLITQAILLNEEAVALYRVSNYKKATRKFKLALALIELANQGAVYFDFKIMNKDEDNKDHLKNIYSNIALAYRDFGDYRNADKYYQKAFELNTKLYGESHQYTLKAWESIQECFQLAESKIRQTSLKP